MTVCKMADGTRREEFTAGLQLMESSSDYNPFAAPAFADHASERIELKSFRAFVRRFHQEARALAGLSVFGSMIVVLLTSAMIRNAHYYVTLIGILGFGSSLGLVAVCIQITRRNVMAVYVLLAIVSMLIIVSLGTFPATGGGGLLAAMFLGFAAAQCFRVIRTARRLTAAGIPLRTTESQLTREMLERLIEVKGHK